MKARLFGIALMFMSVWGFAALCGQEYEIRSLPYELGVPVFFMAMVLMALGAVMGLAMVVGAVVLVDGEEGSDG